MAALQLSSPPNSRRCPFRLIARNHIPDPVSAVADSDLARILSGLSSVRSSTVFPRFERTKAQLMAAVAHATNSRPGMLGS